MGVIHNRVTATIANGQTVGAAFYVGAKAPLILEMPAAFTGASVSFQGSSDGVTYQAIHIGGALYSEVVTQGTNCQVNQGALAGSPWLKIVSFGAEGAAREIVVVTRAVR